MSKRKVKLLTIELEPDQVACAHCDAPVTLPCCFHCEGEIGPDGVCVNQCGWSVEEEEFSEHLCDKCHVEEIKREIELERQEEAAELAKRRSKS